MTCFNGESVAEVTETTLDVKFFEHERPHGKEELEGESKTERDKERKREEKKSWELPAVLEIPFAAPDM